MCIQIAATYHIAFANLLGAKCLRGAQVHAIVVAQVVVGNNGSGLEASSY